MSSLSAVRYSPAYQSSSPYLSESAHVLSLQQPASESATPRTSREPQISPASTSSQPDVANNAGCKHDRKPSTEHSAGFGKLVYQKVMKELETKLKPKRHKSVCTVVLFFFFFFFFFFDAN
jgi:hypothetical protein